MPYKLKKSRGRDAYWVVNKQTGKKYSHEPLPYETAMKQMRALYSQEAGNKIDLKGGELSPEETAKQLLMNLRMKAEADKQVEKAQLDGNYLTGGYGGTDEDMPSYGSLNFQSYMRTMSDDLKDGFNSFINTLAGILDNVGLGSAFRGLVTAVGMLGQIMGKVFTGDLKDLATDGNALLVALDSLAKELPAVNVVRSVGSILSKVIKNEPITDDDFLELGTSVADTISAVATAGTGTATSKVATSAIKKTTKDQIKDALKEAIKDGIKDKLKESAKTSLKDAAMEVIFNHFIEQNPQLPVYNFSSQITGNERNVILGTISGVEIPESALAPDDNYYNLFNYLRTWKGLNKNLKDPNLLKYLMRYQREVERDNVPATYRTNGMTQREKIIDEMTAEDKVKISDDEYVIMESNLEAIDIDEESIKALKNIPKKQLIGVYIGNPPAYYPLNEEEFKYSSWLKEYYNYFTGNDASLKEKQRHGSNIIEKIQESTPVYNTSGIIKSYSFFESLGDYDILTTNDKIKLNNKVDEINAQIQNKVKEYQDEDKAFITSAIDEIDDAKDDIVEGVLDSIMKDIGEAGGTLNTKLYNQLKDVADNTAQQDITKYVTDAVMKAQMTKYEESGERLTEDEQTQLVDDLKNGLAQAVQDDVLASTSKMTLTSKSKELESMKEEYDKAKQEYIKKIEPMLQYPDVYYYPARKEQVIQGAIADLNERTKNIIPKYEALQKEVLEDLSIQKYDTKVQSTLADNKKQTLRDNITQKYDLLNQQAKASFENETSKITGELNSNINTIRASLNTSAIDNSISKLSQEKNALLVKAENDLYENWKSTQGNAILRRGQPLSEDMKRSFFNSSIKSTPSYNTDLNNLYLKSGGTKLESQINDLMKQKQDLISKNESKINDINKKYNPLLDKAKKTYDSIIANNTKARDNEIKAGLEAIDKDKSGEFRVKSVDEIKQELGLKPKPALVKQPVPVIQPPVVSSQQQQKIQPALSKNVPVAPTVVVQPAKPVEVPKEEKPVEKVMTTPASAPAPAPVLSEQERQYKANLEEIRKYDKERQTGEIKDYKPAVQKALDDIERQQVPIVQRKSMRVRQPKTTFGRQATAPSRRFGR